MAFLYQIREGTARGKQCRLNNLPSLSKGVGVLLARVDLKWKVDLFNYCKHNLTKLIMCVNEKRIRVKRLFQKIILFRPKVGWGVEAPALGSILLPTF